MNTTTEAYIFVHFIGDEKTPTDEQLYFALSRDGVALARIFAPPANRHCND